MLGATLATLWGGWVWWYRADFPFPRLPDAQTFGIDLSRHKPWYYGKEEALRIWRIKRETRRLRLEGTVWGDQLDIVTLGFQADGRLALDVTPGGEKRASKSDPFGPNTGPTLEARAALAALNGAPYRRVKDVQWHDSWWPDQPNVELAGTPWDCFLTYHGSVLQVSFYPSDPASDLPLISLHLTSREP